MTNETALDIESTTKPEIRLTDDGEDDLCIEISGKAFLEDVEPFHVGKVRIYFAKERLKKLGC